MNVKTQLLTVSLSGILVLSGYANADIVDLSTRKISVISNSQPITQTPESSQNQSQTQRMIQTPSNTNYAFPIDLKQGYWAMTTMLNNIASTVRFSDSYIHIYQFQCHPDGSFEKLKTYSYELEPSQTGMGLKREDGSHYSELRLIKFEPKQTLFMHQNFIANLELRQAMPNGIDLHYVYSPNLVPVCQNIAETNSK